VKWQFLPHGKHCVSVKKTNWLMLFRGHKYFFLMRITRNLHTHDVGELHSFGDKAVGTYSNE